MNNEHKAVPMSELYEVIRDVLSAGRDATIYVTGNSMNPLWHHRQSRVVLTACDPSKIARGDVPLYRRDNGAFVLHRVASVREDGLFDMVGDNQFDLEKGIRADQILAVTKGYYDQNGRLISVDDRHYRRYWKRRLATRPIRWFIGHAKASLRFRIKRFFKK